MDLTLSVRDIALPIGISFFTFQGMSYVIDVWRDNPNNGRHMVQKNIVDLALYISMFPQLIAGPIVRYHDIQQFLRERKHSFKLFSNGIELFICGLAKKVLIANTLGQTVETIMIDNVNMIDAPIAWFGAFCYSLQLFFDFSGYSDMAIGLGKMFGFEFQKNFNYPYISTSVSEFWRRWHISLSQWFRDYLYIPLGGNRKGNVYLHLFVVFLATGIWHGAGWGFIIWGIWHGLFVILERYYKTHMKKQLKVPHIIRWFYTMFIVLLGWTMFKIVDVKKAIYYFSVMFSISRPDFVSNTFAYYLNRRTIAILIAAVLCCFPWKTLISSPVSTLLCQIKGSIFLRFIRRALVFILLILCYLFIANSTYNPFIYFRF